MTEAIDEALAVFVESLRQVAIDQGKTVQVADAVAILALETLNARIQAGATHEAAIRQVLGLADELPGLAERAVLEARQGGPV